MSKIVITKTINNRNSPCIALIHSYLTWIEFQCRSSWISTGLLERPQTVQFDISSHGSSGCIRQIIGDNEPKKNIDQFFDELIFF